MQVNVNGLFLCCREIAPVMRDAGYGRIVNIASVAGKDGNPNASAYSASKAAVIALTKSLGKELADTGVRVQLRNAGGREDGDLRANDAEQHIEFMLSKIPMGRFGTPRGGRGAWWAGCAPRIARSPPAPCSICRAGGPPTNTLKTQRRKQEQ